VCLQCGCPFWFDDEKEAEAQHTHSGYPITESDMIEFVLGRFH